MTATLQVSPEPVGSARERPPAGVRMRARISSVSTAGQVVLVLQAEGEHWRDLGGFFLFVCVAVPGYGGSSGDLKLQAPVHWRGVSILQEKWWRASWASGEERVQQLEHADEAYSNYRWTNQMFKLKTEHVIYESQPENCTYVKNVLHKYVLSFEFIMSQPQKDISATIIIGLFMNIPENAGVKWSTKAAGLLCFEGSLQDTEPHIAPVERSCAQMCVCTDDLWLQSAVGFNQG